MKKIGFIPALLAALAVALVLAACGSPTSLGGGEDGTPSVPGTSAASGTVPVTGVSLNKQSTGLVVGGTETLFATVAPTNATNQKVTWGSNNTSVVTVSDGTVTGVGEGTAIITVTTQDGNKTATCTVTVSGYAIPVTGVSLNKQSTGLVVGGTEYIYSTILPNNATNQGVTWDSDNTSVATVSASGAVKGVSLGTANITVTTQDGGYQASCTVSVIPIAVTFNSVTANGSTIQTTTQLTLSFSRAISGLAATDITLSGVSGVTKGTLSGSGPSYTLPISGFTSGGTLSVEAAKTGYNVSGSPKTVTVYYIPTGTATLTITFAQIADAAPSITGPTLYRTTSGGPTSATLTVANPGQYSSISWRVQDTAVTGTGASFVLSASNAAYNLIGTHFVTVTVIKDGAPYNKTVTFNVAY